MRLPLDPDAAHAAVAGRDSGWDGRLFFGVATTGIYCRPSCPARTPRPENCRFFPTAAAAVAAGFRACRRCRPETCVPTSSLGIQGDIAARAVRLIAEGALDSGSVNALAQRLGVSERHLHRVLVAEVGASPQQLGRTRRAHAARALIDQTSLPLTDIAFAAGFGSIRQFNEVMRQEFGVAPRALRPARHVQGPRDDGRESSEAPNLTVRLAYRPPFATAPLRASLTAHAIAGVERPSPDEHVRIVDGRGGPAVVRLVWDPDPHTPKTPCGVTAQLRLTDLSDVMGVVTAVRRWLDLDADPQQVDRHLVSDRLIGHLVASRPGLRVPGAVNGPELAICGVLGQQVSVARALNLQGLVATSFGASVPDGLLVNLPRQAWRVFPRPEVLSEAGPQAIRDAANLTRVRAAAVHAVATAIAGGLAIEPGVDIRETERTLRALPGIGPWTSAYIALRALRDPDAFLSGDLVARRALAKLTGVTVSDMPQSRAERSSLAWRPWRAYALQHLWTEEVYA